jgi:PmbA protein
MSQSSVDVSSELFSFSREQFAHIIEDAFGVAKQLGATDCSIDLSEEKGMDVTVHQQALETIAQNHDKSAEITIYLGQRKGHASTSDLSPQGMAQTVRAAFDIARFTAEDPYAGLPEADLIARHHGDLDQFHPWRITPSEATVLAQRAEQAALSYHADIQNSEGATVSVQHGHFLSANTHGFMGGYPYSRHYLSVAPIAKRGDDMQRDDWYSHARDASELDAPETIGKIAAERALKRLGGRRVPTCQVPVLFEAPLVPGLIGHFIQAVLGGSLYRQSSFLLDSLGKPIFADHISLIEQPHQAKMFGCSWFDDEGVATKTRDVIAGGVLQGYFLSCYSARKLGMVTTGNAGGAHHLTLRSTLSTAGADLNALVKQLHRGLLVTELMGQGVNPVTGDYSRGASGFWVENGEIQYPVEEITIAGNLKAMYQQIVAVGGDYLLRGSKYMPSLIVDGMTIAGE